MHVTKEIASDVKRLNLSYGGELSYETCQRGLTPIAFFEKSEEAMLLEDIDCEVQGEATTRTVEDVRSYRAKAKSEALKDGEVVIKVLHSYIKAGEQIAG